MKELCIKDICKKDSSSLKQKDLHESGKYPVYGASGIAGYLDTYEQSKPYIAIVKDGSGIGRVSFQEAQSSLIGTMQYILPKEGYDIRYIGYCLQSLDLSKYKQGAAIPHIYFRDYGERKVNVTDKLSEQQRIVSRLDAAFAHIDELKANAEKQLSEARALFQKALEKAMEPKEGWEEKTLGDIANVIHGKNQKDVQSVNGTYPIYGSGGNIMGYATDYLCEAGTTILGRKGSINNPLFIETRFWNVDTAFGITPKDNNSSKFLYYIIMGIDWSKKNTGTTLPSLTQQVVKSVVIYVPNSDSQRYIVSRLDSLSENVKKLEEIQRKIIAECDALKQALLRKVFE